LSGDEAEVGVVCGVRTIVEGGVGSVLGVALRPVAKGAQESGHAMTPTLALLVPGGHSITGGGKRGDPFVVVCRVPGTGGDGSVTELLPARAWPSEAIFVQCRDQAEQLGDLAVGGQVKVVGAFGHLSLPPGLVWLLPRAARRGRVTTGSVL
jgi:hypothetical protein